MASSSPIDTMNVRELFSMVEELTLQCNVRAMLVDPLVTKYNELSRVLGLENDMIFQDLKVFSKYSHQFRGYKKTILHYLVSDIPYSIELMKPEICASVNSLRCHLINMHPSVAKHADVAIFAKSLNNYLDPL